TLHFDEKWMYHTLNLFNYHVSYFSTVLLLFLHSSVSLMMPAINTHFIHLHQSIEKTVFAYMNEVRGMILRRFLLMLQEFSILLRVNILVRIPTRCEI